MTVNARFDIVIIGAGLGRHRTPIDELYLCHQTSGHPGGLCLMAIPYNLMHILIEDGIAEPGAGGPSHPITSLKREKSQPCPVRAG